MALIDKKIFKNPYYRAILPNFAFLNFSPQSYREVNKCLYEFF